MTTSHDIDALSRIRRSAAEYSGRQGLFLVVLGLLAGYLAFVLPESRTLSAGVLVGFVALFAIVGAYYRRKFGSVTTKSRGVRAWSWLVPIAFVGAAIIAIAAANAAGLANHLVGGLLFAILLVLMAGRRWREHIHYVIAGAALAVITVLPLGFLTVSGDHPFSHGDPVWLLIAFGVLVAVVGLIDHRALVRALPTPAGEAD